MLSGAEQFALAQAHHRAGRRQQAEGVLRTLLGAEPANAPALHLLGSIAYEDGRLEEARVAFGRAAGADPACASYASCLGAACQALGKLEEALGWHQRAVALAPADPQALSNLGITLASLGRHPEAADALERARRAEPPDAGVLCNLAAALKALGRLDEAEAAARAALALAPDLPPAHNNLGNVLLARGDADGAAACFARAAALEPRFVPAQQNLAQALQARGDLPRAARSYAQAVRLRPGDAASRTRLGHVLLMLNRGDEALAQCREAVRLAPADAEAHNNLGNAHAARGELDEAVSRYDEAIRLAPGWSVPAYNRGVALLSQGRPAEGRTSLEQALALNPADAVAHSTYAAALLYDPDAGPEAGLAEARRWAECHAKGIDPVRSHANDADPDRRLRVGYVSPDFRAHAVAFFVEPLLRHHDRTRVECFCYADVAAPDATTQRLKGLADQWRPTWGLTDAALADRVRCDGIDLLVDLCGHLAHNRLLAFARRPAPVQLSYLGYPGTTGLSAIAYRLGDAVTDPPGEPAPYTEELVCLSGPFCCYAPPEDAPPYPALPSRRLGAVTFGSLHKLEKLSARVVEVWCRLLHAVPGSRLLLCRNTLHGPTAGRWREQFTSREVEPERVVLRRVEAVDMGHLRAYAEVDVALDTFPWCGHTTACEALWMGVPVVTLRGDRHAGRMAASVLQCVGLGDLAAADANAYVRVAVELAADAPRRAVLRGGLRGRLRASPLCDGAAFTRGLEETYRGLWRRWCAGGRAAGNGAAPGRP